jgi:hypothetical protein
MLRVGLLSTWREIGALGFGATSTWLCDAVAVGADGTPTAYR